jgi:CRP/FNR family cyclic AMP-dependent transcriptional regulator
LPVENVTCVANSETLDFRGMPVWERPSLALDALDRAPLGAPVTFITEIEPRGLSARVLDERFGRVLVETSMLGPESWLVRMTRRTESTTRNPIVRVLEATPPFAHLPAAVLDRLAAAGSTQTARRGRLLVEAGGEWRALGIVADGVAAVSSGTSSRDHITMELFPFEVFGISAFFDRGAPVANVIAMTKTTRIVNLPWTTLTDVARENPDLLFGLGSLLGRRKRELSAKLSSQSALPIVGRVARVLLPHAKAERGLSPAMGALASMTQSQIAAAAGTVKEVAARAIAELDERGLLKRERGHIRYLDRQGLIELLRELGGS